MSLLLFIETLMMAHIFLSSEWEKVCSFLRYLSAKICNLFPSVTNLCHTLYQDLPEEPTGRFDDFKHYVESELNLCKWFAVLIVLAQVYIIMKT